MPFFFNYWGKQRIAKLEKIGKPLQFSSLPIPLFHFGLGNLIPNQISLVHATLPLHTINLTGINSNQKWFNG